MVTAIRARPTTYKGVRMRSRLEAGFAAWLDKTQLSWMYEPCAFAGAAGQYLPDFRIDQVHCSWMFDPATVYVEVKPEGWPFDDDDAFPRLMRTMVVIWESEPNAVLVLATPTGREGAQLATLGVLSPDAGPGGDLAWPLIALWSMSPSGHPGISMPLGYMKGPWPGNYMTWSVR